MTNPTNTKTKLTWFLVFTILIFTAAFVIYFFQTGKLKIGADILWSKTAYTNVKSDISYYVSIGSEMVNQNYEPSRYNPGMYGAKVVVTNNTTDKYLKNVKVPYYRNTTNGSGTKDITPFLWNAEGKTIPGYTASGVGINTTYEGYVSIGDLAPGESKSANLILGSKNGGNNSATFNGKPTMYRSTGDKDDDGNIIGCPSSSKSWNCEFYDYAINKGIMETSGNEANSGWPTLISGNWNDTDYFKNFFDVDFMAEEVGQFLVTVTTTTNSITLSWDAINGANKYIIYDCSDNKIAETTDTTYTIENVSAGNYCYYVVALKDDTELARSLKVNVTVSTAPTTSPTATSTSTATSTATSTPVKSIDLSKVADLVSTGSALWFNIIIALMLAIGVGYFVFRKEIYK